MSIQDDYFDLEDYFNELGDEYLKEKFNRIWEWGCECENDNEKLRPIVNNIRSAISMMFEKED